MAGTVRFDNLTNGILQVDGSGNLSVTSGGLLGNGADPGDVPYWNGSSWVTGSNNLYNNGGNIGINNTNPQATLHVSGNAYISNGLSVDNTVSLNNDLIVSGNSYLNGAANVGQGLTVSGTAYTNYGGTAEIMANGDGHTGGGITIADDGGFYDFNDGWVTYLGSTGLKIAGNNGQTSAGNLLVQGNLTNTGNVQFQNYTNGLLQVDGGGNLSVTNAAGFIANSTSQQTSANINIDGTGVIGTALNVGSNSTPNSTLQVAGSVSLPYVVANSGAYTLTAADHTVRQFGGCNNIVFPDASTCVGRTYVIIASNGSGTNVGISPINGQTVYDDVTNATITFLTPGHRISVQSDGSNWIVIGN